MHDRGLLKAHPQFLPNFAIHPEYGAAAVAPVQKVRTDPPFPWISRPRIFVILPNACSMLAAGNGAAGKRAT